MADAYAAPGDFLGHDGVFEQPKGNQIAHRAGDQQRQQHFALVRQFKREHDGCQRRARCPRENGGHANDDPHAGIRQTRRDPVGKTGKRTTQGAAHEQQRPQHSSGTSPIPGKRSRRTS